MSGLRETLSPQRSEDLIGSGLLGRRGRRVAEEQRRYDRGRRQEQQAGADNGGAPAHCSGARQRRFGGGLVGVETGDTREVLEARQSDRPAEMRRQRRAATDLRQRQLIVVAEPRFEIPKLLAQ